MKDLLPYISALMIVGPLVGFFIYFGREEKRKEALLKRTIERSKKKPESWLDEPYDGHH